MDVKQKLQEVKNNGYASVTGGILISPRFISDITSATVEGIADAIHQVDAGGPGSGRHKTYDSLPLAQDYPLANRYKIPVLDDVSISKLIRTQDKIDDHKVGQLARKRFVDLIDIVKQGKKLFIIDGHNRVASRFARGEDTVPAKIYRVLASTKATYPQDHKAGMAVPKGGSSCASCKYLADNGKDCTNEHFQKWNGSVEGIADAIHQVDAGGPGSGRHKGAGFRGFGGKYYQEYGFLDPYKNKVLQGSSNGDHDLLARTRLQIKSKKGNESGVAVQNGYVRYIVTPTHTAVFQHLGNESGDSAIKSFLLGKNDIKDVILHVGNDTNTRIEQLSKEELLNRYDDKGITAATTPTYPQDHKAGMAVPKGGSSCASCKYLADNGKDCTNEHFQKWNGSEVIPASEMDSYCSDWFEPKSEIKAAKEEGWHGVDLDGTIAYYDGFKGNAHIGHIIEGEALEKVKHWLKKGERVKIFTVRATEREAIKPIQELCKKVFGQVLEITDKKDSNMIDFLDDRAHRVETNTGKILAADETSFEGDYKGSLWNGIRLVGFTGPEEEALRATLSRIPPELLVYVKCIQSAKELNAKHGKYLSDEHKILFNPGNLLLRQRFGKGELSISHADLTVVHEVGHSLYDNLTPEEKQKWLDISGWIKGTKQGQAPAYEERRPGWPHDTSKWTHRMGATFARYYGEKSPNEDFADAFGFFLLGKAHKIGIEKRQYFEAYIKQHVHRYPQASIQSPSKK